MNESYCRLLKTSRDRLIGAHFSEFIPPERLDEAVAAFADLKRKPDACRVPPESG